MNKTSEKTARTITITLTESEAEVLSNLARALDPSGSIKETSIAKGAFCEGLVRSCRRLEVGLPLEWLTTEAVKRYIASVK